MSFVPTIERISAGKIREIPGLEGVIRYWADETDTLEDWHREAGDGLGVGFAMRHSDEFAGFALYAAAEYLPRANRLTIDTIEPDKILLAYVGGDTRTRRQLLVRVLKEMRQHGVPDMWAVSSDLGHPQHTTTDFLIESGWQPVRRGWTLGKPYTLMRAELGSSVEVGEFARGLIDKVRLPKLRRDHPLPGAFVREESPAAYLKAESKAEALRT